MKRTVPIYNYNSFLFERVYVETPLDTDGDGKRDLIAVYIRRPKAKEVPAIFVANPYMLGCNEDVYELCDVDINVKAYPTQNINIEDIKYKSEKYNLPPERVSNGMAENSFFEEPEFEVIPEWYKYFNTRGYATVFCAGLGTRGSDGVLKTGSQDEIIAFKSVIEWLGGRRKAYTNREDNIEIKAKWCNKKVAMTGKSYLGTLSIGVATTGVEELKTIIPEAAISNWYSYFRQNGLAVSCEGWQGDDIFLLSRYCTSRRLDYEDYKNSWKLIKTNEEQLRLGADRESGNYNLFWDERNYLNNVDKIKASVMIVHGLSDWNVKMDQCIEFWKRLEEYKIPRRMFLHLGDHCFIHNHQSIEFTKMVHEWLDYWLYDIDNGIMDVFSEVYVQNNTDQYMWHTSNEWPPREADIKTFTKSVNKKITDNVELAGYNRDLRNQSEWLKNIVENADEERQYRVIVPIESENIERLSGEVKVKLRASVDKKVAIISAMLVDYSNTLRITTNTQKVTSKPMNLGLDAGELDVVQFMAEDFPSKYKVITRGWINIQNNSSIYSKEEISIGEEVEYTIKLLPTDYTLNRNSKLAIIIYGSDAEFTLRPIDSTTINIAEVSGELPLISRKGC